MSIPTANIEADKRSYRNISKVDFIEEYINDALAGRKQNTKENIARTLRKNFPAEPPKPMVDFAYVFVRELLSLLKDDETKDLMNNKSVWVRDTEIYNVSVLRMDTPVEILTYDGPLDWQLLKRYFYKLYMTFYNDETLN